MYILQKYLLVLIICCFPRVLLQNKELIQQEQHSLDKDSVSKIETLISYEDEALGKKAEQIHEINSSDSMLDESIQWKFRKNLILGN